MQQQLVNLLDTLNATEPHYIRCVKPNNLLKPAIFENQNVLQQLRCGVRIAYPTFHFGYFHMNVQALFDVLICYTILGSLGGY